MSSRAPRNRRERRKAARQAAAAEQAVSGVRKAFKGIVGKPTPTQASTGAKSRRSDDQRAGRLAQLDSRTVKTDRGKVRLVTGAAAIEALARVEKGGKA